MRRFQIGIEFKRQGDVLGQCQGAPQRPALVEDTKPTHEPIPLLRFQSPEVDVPVKDPAPRGGLQADQVPQRVLFPQPLPPMMMKMSPRLTVKFRSRWRTKPPNAIVSSFATMQGPLFRPSPGRSPLALQIPTTWHSTVMIAVATMMLTMLVTTADVVAAPTAEALLPHCIPRRQPESATITPNTVP